MLVEVRFRPVPLGPDGPTDRPVSAWRILRLPHAHDARQTWDRVVGLAPTGATKSTAIAHVDPARPLVITRSGRHYWLEGPPASLGDGSLRVELLVALMRAELAAKGLPDLMDVSEDYWSRWRDNVMN